MRHLSLYYLSRYSQNLLCFGHIFSPIYVFFFLILLTRLNPLRSNAFKFSLTLSFFLVSHVLFLLLSFLLIVLPFFTSFFGFLRLYLMAFFASPLTNRFNIWIVSFSCFLYSFARLYLSIWLILVLFFLYVCIF